MRIAREFLRAIRFFLCMSVCVCAFRSVAMLIGGRLCRRRSGLRRDEAADKMPTRGRRRLGSQKQIKNEHPVV